MCLIITREPKFELPFEKFKSAILNNPDGYGLAIPDENNRLQVLRSADTADPEKLYRVINEELIEKKIMVHLRYTTAGETNLRNAHPFPILERDKDGIDLRMAHNGTIHKFKTIADKGESDTRAFVKEYVRPLFKRLAKGMEPEELLSDDFTRHLLEDQLPSSSVLTFLDGQGNSMVCNPEGNGGKQEPEWYYSNIYSFNPKHREPTKPAYYPPKVTYMGHNAYNKWKDTYTTLKFTTKYDIDKPQYLTRLTDQSIEGVVKAGDAEILIKELIYEYHKAHLVNRRLNMKVKKLEGEKK